MTLNQNLADSVTIGIATKNRWQDLQTTLIRIKEAGLGEIPLVIFDDSSEQSCPWDISSFSSNVTLKRFVDSKGYIVRRNQLAEAIQTKYYLSLDDDSFPVAGSLLNAVQFAESHDDLLCLSFPVYNPILKEYQSRSLHPQPYPVRCFIGCGHLLHRQIFLQMGGYREELIHQGEEMDIAVRAFQNGLFCYHFPDFQIHHTASNVARNWYRVDYYGARNNVLWNDWYVPSKLKLIKQSRTFIARLIHAFKVGRISTMQGQIAGFKEISDYQKYRKRMSLEQFKSWNNLPIS